MEFFEIFNINGSREITISRIERSDWPIAFQAISREPDFSWTCGFRRIIEDHKTFHFTEKKVHINELDFRQITEKPIFGPFWDLFDHFWANGIFFEKIGLCHFFTFIDP